MIDTGHPFDGRRDQQRISSQKLSAEVVNNRAQQNKARRAPSQPQAFSDAGLELRTSAVCPPTRPNLILLVPP
jgi:hypothetical protein